MTKSSGHNIRGDIYVDYSVMYDAGFVTTADRIVSQKGRRMLDYRQFGSGAGRITDALFLLEPDGDTFRYAYIDDAYTRLTGLRTQDVVGAPLETFLTSEQIAFLTAECAQAVAAHGSVSYEE